MPTNSFFSDALAAHRYSTFRPNVHSKLIAEVTPLLGKLPLGSALDVGCGTGNSTDALRSIARRVVGVDRSPEMLKYAEGKCDRIVTLPAEQVSQPNETFDLISTSMAFHWFDLNAAISQYKLVTKSSGWWLIYNFYFGGSVNSIEFNEWSRERYLRVFPTPPRKNRNANKVLEADPTVELVRNGAGSYEISLGLDELIGYLTTQSNVEQAVKNGMQYEEVEHFLRGQFVNIHMDDIFKYSYRWELYRMIAEREAEEITETE